ncbi:LemA family protein [Spiroplasma floricola]|uniref:LemA protein n=1 Tax=Spiroplasma floricola 23-6 TaxID=1336749 RepID=A0A2K8SES9_9MOLU|nr:LemA family protein [Spiroplasma floricola]AUB31932.1 LemA protein [Spiroplasma floricola 23-6]
MANLLDEQSGPFKEEGQDIKVINKQIEIKVGTGSKVFEIFLWLMLILPGLIFTFKKIGARNYFSKLEQRIQASASEVDNYLEQRYQILQNVAGLLEKSINLDKDVMKGVAALRSGNNFDAARSSELSEQLDKAYGIINVAFERYPDLKSQETIIAAMQKNDYTQREISAARSNYNDYVSRWNQDVQVWPTKKIVAAKQGYTTRIPFTASVEVKQKARESFF